MTTTALLDANVLIALMVEDHVHHAAAGAWAADWEGALATSPITQGALLRTLLRFGVHATDALTLLQAVEADPRHEWWPDDAHFTARALRGVVGHRQITDCYLAELARQHGAALATLDNGLAAAHPDVAILVPS
ncbi:MAG TPA: VapC toxin family PIN domain ribonuclease [Acidimicrobiaceae bacterium]|nr:VapC toxin family PIN domain ribonuclease [Acidimicrobiaceae bacterium]